MKPFSVVIAVYGARHALELTLRTLLAVSKNYIEHVYLIDSSYLLRGYFQETKKFIDDFVGENKQTSVHWVRDHSHGLKLDAGILEVETPYALLLDSDVEFHSGEVFQKVLELYETDKNLFMVGHGDPMISMGRRYIEEENLYVGGLFVRTEVAKKYVKNGVSFHRKDAVEGRDDQKGRIRVFYDVSSFMYHVSRKQGHRSIRLEMNGKYFSHLKHGSWTEHQSEEGLEILKKRLEEKPWLTLPVFEHFKEE